MYRGNASARAETLPKNWHVRRARGISEGLLYLSRFSPTGRFGFWNLMLFVSFGNTSVELTGHAGPLPWDRHFFTIHVLQISKLAAMCWFLFLLKVWWPYQITIAMLGSPQGWMECKRGCHQEPCWVLLSARVATDCWTVTTASWLRGTHGEFE